MEEWQVGVYKEKAELELRYGRLKLFLVSDHIIESKERDRLNKQLKIMIDYIDVLEERISFFF